MRNRIVCSGAVLGRTLTLALLTVLCVGGLSGSASAQSHYVRFNIKDALQTTGGSINNNGYIGGWYMDQSNRNHGILRSPNGAITVFNVSGATDTFGNSINSSNVITGEWFAFYEHGYVRQLTARSRPSTCPTRS